LQNSSSDVEEVEYSINSFEGRETGEKQPKEEGRKKGTQRMGLENHLTLAEANSTTNRSLAVKIAGMES